MFASLLALLPFLASANAFFIMQQKILQTTRLDPIVNPGAVSGHVHTIAGGSGFAQSVSYDSMRASRCTTAVVTEDKSNYWIPQLYHYDPTDQSYTMVPVDYMNAYYLPRPSDKDKKVYAFPDGLRMLAGEGNRRDFDSSDPSDKAISYVCLDYSGKHKGDPNWDQRNSFFPHNDCPQGVRAQVNFPNCWDGVNLDSADHQSHMAWPSGGVDGGDCPASHPVHLVSLFYEFIFHVQDFQFNGGNNPTFVWANGDTTGYGLHADFINGWPSLVNGTNILQRAIDECNINNGVGGNLQDCPPFVPFLDSNAAYACQPENPIVNENIGDNGKIFSLPGNNPLYTGPGMVVGNNTDTEDPGLVNTTSPLPAGWSRTGCVSEPSSSGARGLLAASFTSPNMTRAACVNFCNSKNLPLAGVEFGQECYCDVQLRNGATNATLLPDSSCGYDCPGNKYENCGGARTFDLFVNPALFPAGPTLPAGWKAAGCQTEASNGRALSGYTFASANMTNELCASTCASRNFSIAGTEYARECYCGNSFNAGSVAAASTQCNMVCAGSASSTCGGGSRLSIFTGPAGATVSSASASASSSASSSASASASSSSSASVSASSSASSASTTSSSSASVAASSSASSTSTSSSSSASASASSAAAPLPSGWTANGCVVEGNPRVLSAYSFTSGSMTTELCLNTCYSKGYLYAGTQYASECYCSNTLAATSAPDSACAMPCKGNANQICGGSSRLSTYKSNIQAGPAPAPAGWSAIGCLTDSGNARSLNGYKFTSDNMNYTLCASTCGSKGFNYAGISYARECYCGNSQGGSVAASSDCSMSCSGDMYSKCGGSWRLTAFKSNTDNTATTATSASASASASATSTSTSAAVATPTGSTLPAGWSTIGCNVDSPSQRVITGMQFSANNMTWNQCVSSCSSRGYVYAGVEYGSECYCGFTAQLSAADQSTCAMKCSGDSTINCGGPNRLQVFYNADAAAKAKASASTLPGNWKSYGCIVDSTSARALQSYRMTNSQMTYSLCASTCQANGFAYAGVEYSNECYCANTANIQDAASGCNMPCSGDSANSCGGAARMNLFYNADSVNPKAAASASSTSTSSSSSTSSASSTSTSTSTSTASSTSTSTATSTSTSTSTSSSTSSAAATPTYVPPKAYRGCYADQGNPRTLNGTSVSTDPQMTNEMCIAKCASLGMALAGTEYNRECYCGQTLNLSLQLAESRCSSTCLGQAGAKCGGGYALSIYETGNGTVTTFGQAPANPPTRRALVRGGVRLSI